MKTKYLQRGHRVVVPVRGREPGVDGPEGYTSATVLRVAEEPEECLLEVDMPVGGPTRRHYKASEILGLWVRP